MARRHKEKAVEQIWCILTSENGRVASLIIEQKFYVCQEAKRAGVIYRGLVLTVSEAANLVAVSIIM